MSTALDLLVEIMPSNAEACPTGYGQDVSILIAGEVMRWHVQAPGDQPAAEAEPGKCPVDPENTELALRAVVAMLAAERRGQGPRSPIVAAGVYRLRAQPDGGFRLMALTPDTEPVVKTLGGKALRAVSAFPAVRGMLDTLRPRIGA